MLTIDLSALARNWCKLRDQVAPAECAAVVKADAYGIGIGQAAPTLAKAGCRTFFVAHISEGIRVRAAIGPHYPDCRIYVLNGLLPGADIQADYLTPGLVPVLSGAEELLRWGEAGSKAGYPLPAALHVETGMNRLGLPYAEASKLTRSLSAMRVDLLMSHFISAEQRNASTNDRQIEDFIAFTRMFPGVKASLSNSSGIFLPRRPHFDLVRPGYALYGGNPVPGLQNPMEPVVQLDADILQTRWINAGESVGYNGIWIASRRTRLAVLAIGYADGFPRGAAHSDVGGDKGEAIVGGVRCQIVGRVSMDLIVIDVTDVREDLSGPGASAGLLGAEITIDDLAQRSGTIGYEILTGLSRRYYRVHKGG